MRKGIAKPEKNKGEKLVLPVRTMNVLEAHQALSMGHQVDVMAGYYEKEGVLQPDFYMMDRIGKLHALAGYREKLKESRQKYESQVKEIDEEERKKQLDELVNQEIQKRSDNEKPKE